MHTMFLLTLAVIAAEPADAWPGFRGRGDSHSPSEALPLTWSESKNIAWTTDLPGSGQSSPVVVNGSVIVTSTDGANKERVLVSSLDLRTGKIDWTQSFPADQPAEVSPYISQAAPTPVVDAQRIYAFFETGNLVALDHEGNTLWKRSITGDYGPFRGNHGLGSSLAATRDSIIVLVCHDGPSYTLALDKETGKTQWKTERPQEVSWSSPIIVGDGKQQRVIISSNGTCEALDAATGEQLWVVEGLEGNTVPSATVTDELVIVGSSDKRQNLAIRRGGKGNVTESHIAWRSEDATATFSSPLYHQGYIYMVSRAGVAYCVDAKDGSTIWAERIGDSCWASPLAAGDRVYFFGKGGKTTVVQAGPQWKVLAENSLPVEDRVYGVAAVGDRLVVRTGKKVICLK